MSQLRLLVNRNEVPLVLMLENRFADRAKKSQEKKKIVPEQQPHMQKIYQVYTSKIAPMAKEDHPATAEDVYNAILHLWHEAMIMGDGGISEERFDLFKANLDSIRQEWAENPNAIEGYDYDNVVSRETYVDEDGKKRTKVNYQPIFVHKIGKYGYMTEKEHLAAYGAQWYTAGAVGSAGRFDRGPTIGTNQWADTPDGSGTASKDPTKKKRVNKGVTKVDSIFNQFAPPIESIDRLAALIPEDVEDTWLDDGYGGLLVEQAGLGDDPQMSSIGGQTIDAQGVQKAKIAGAKALAELVKYLQVLAKSPDWPKVKQDLGNKLKPFFTGNYAQGLSLK